ncbi:hypothetical protein DZF79_02700 [Vibrio parahaemolyticus]|nr:hypothetical protein [Vibrio parahaemolyticus]
MAELKVKKGDRLAMVTCYLPSITNPEPEIVVKKNLIADSVGEKTFVAKYEWAIGVTRKTARQKGVKFSLSGFGTMLIDGGRYRIVVHEGTDLEPIISDLKSKYDEAYEKILADLNSKITKISAIKIKGEDNIVVREVDCAED